MDFEREQTIERGVVNLETGEFPMVLASEGEASDGHILSIAGLDIAARMPMLFGHSSSPDIPALGSIMQPTKSRNGEGIAIQRAIGAFNLNGDDSLLGVRRGIMQLVADGDLSAMSLFWRGEGVMRVELPEEHPYHVERSAEGPERFGFFFETSRGLEGSVVAIGADPLALSGRADAAEDGITRAFFRTLALTPDESGMRNLADAFRAIGDAKTALDAAGCSASDLLRLLDCDDSEELVTVDGVLIPKRIHEMLIGQSRNTMREAFEIVAEWHPTPGYSQTSGYIAPDSNTLILNPSDGLGMTTDLQSEVEDGSREVEVTVRTPERKPGTVNAMSVKEFEDGLLSALSAAAFKLTGRRR